MAELVSAKWGMSVYSSDDHTFEYKQLANPQDHPAILRYFVDWEWYFLGQGNDRNQWLVSAAEESVEFTLLALLQMGKGKPIVVDTDIAPEFLRAIAGDERMVYVYAEDELIRRDYFNRDHLRGCWISSQPCQIRSVPSVRHWRGSLRIPAGLYSGQDSIMCSII